MKAKIKDATEACLDVQTKLQVHAAEVERKRIEEEGGITSLHGSTKCELNTHLDVERDPYGD